MLKSVELIGDDIIEVCIDDKKHELKLNKLEMMELSNRLDKLSRIVPNSETINLPSSELYDEICINVVNNYTNILKRYFYRVGRTMYDKYMIYNKIKRDPELSKSLRLTSTYKNIVLEKELCKISINLDAIVYRYSLEEYVSEILTEENIIGILNKYLDNVNERYDEYRLFIFDRSDLKEPFTITEILIDSVDPRLLTHLGRFNVRKDINYLSVTKRRIVLQAGKDNINLFKRNNYINVSETIDCKGMSIENITETIKRLMKSLDNNNK